MTKLMKDMSRQELIAAIEKETELIANLSREWPDRHEDLYHPSNTAWHQHDTKIRDAHWRRRMLMVHLDGGGDDDIQATAEIG